MTAHERADRSSAIFEARVRGFAWSEIAREHGVSQRQAQRIYAEVRTAAPKLGDHLDPAEFVEELLASYDAALADLAVLGRDSKHDATRLGAIRTRIELIETKYATMMATGVLPSSLSQVSLEIDGRKMSTAVIDVLDRHGVSLEAQREIRLALTSDWERERQAVRELAAA